MREVEGDDWNIHIEKKVSDFSLERMKLTAVVTNPVCQTLYLAVDTSQVIYDPPESQEEGTNIVSMMCKRKLEHEDIECLAQ